MKLKSIISFVFLVLIFTGCGNRDDKISQETKKAAPVREDFDSFFNRFNTQPEFQLSRIVFPFKLKITGDEGDADSIKFIAKKDWIFVNLRKVGGNNGILRKELINKNKVKIIYMTEDTGIEVDHYFLNKGGKWWLCYAYNVSD